MKLREISFGNVRVESGGYPPIHENMCEVLEVFKRTLKLSKYSYWENKSQNYIEFYNKSKTVHISEKLKNVFQVIYEDIHGNRQFKYYKLEEV